MLHRSCSRFAPRVCGLWAVALVALVVAAAPARALDYDADPFGDADFRDKPILLAKTFSTAGKLELGASFSWSIVEKYMRHFGGMATIDYHLMDELALEIWAGYFGSRYTAIVTSDGGILGNILASPNPRDPNIPDRAMMTFLADAVVLFTPLYGKINLVSEVDINVGVYLLAGVGINGLRTISWEEQSQSLGVKPNFVYGAGLRLHPTTWMSVRLEFRDVNYPDKFAFTVGGEEELYLVRNHMLNVGVTFFPF